MKYNPDSLLSLESIAFQKETYFNELTDIIRLYKEKKMKRSDFEEEISRSVKKRFNINVKLKVNPTFIPNACMFPVVLDERNILLDRMGWDDFFNYCSEYYVKENYRTMKKIAQGDISNTGLLDFKNARVGKLFEDLPTISELNQGLIDILSPEEVAAVFLHEVGHYWTFLSFLGVYTYRNAIINGAVNEFLGVQSQEEKIQIIIEKKNHWDLDIDEEHFKKLDDKSATQVIVGSFNRNFTRALGYTQYDVNTSEVIADQFAIRMGAGKHLTVGLHKILGNNSSFRFSSNWNFFFGIAKIIAGCVTVVANPLGGIFMLAMGALGIADAFSNAQATAGWTYDNNKDRFRRIYQEEITRLKSEQHDPEVLKLLLTNLDIMKKIVDKVAEEKSIPLSILRWVSSDFRSQEARKQYQQAVEELIANQLYVTSAKFKTLQGYI